jgi:hypothetical protein
MKQVRLIKMHLTETCGRVRVGKNLFPIRNGWKEGDALSPLFFNFVLEYTITRVQVNQDDLTLNSTHQLLVIKIKIYRNIILPVALYGCETWSFTLREECRIRVFENRVLRRIFWPKRTR